MGRSIGGEPAIDGCDNLVEEIGAPAFLRSDPLHEAIDALDILRAGRHRARHRRRAAETRRRMRYFWNGTRSSADAPSDTHSAATQS